MTSWTDEAGHKLMVVPPDGLNPGRVEIPHADGEEYGSARFWLDGENDPAEIAAALFEACGQPVPVILDRPDVDPAVSADLGSLGVWLSEGGEVMLGVGSMAAPLGSRTAARKVAALIAAYADAASQDAAVPDPAEVEALARLIEAGAEGRVVHPHGGVTVYADTLARHLLRSGVTLPAGEARDGA